MAKPLVRVDWIDSVGQAGWGDYNDDTDLYCVSAGHLVSKDRKRIVLALNRSAYGYGDYITIPRVAVRRITVLQTAKHAGDLG